MADAGGHSAEVTGAEVTGSEREWLRVREYLTKNRYDLAVSAAGRYPALARVAGTPLLAARRWLPPVPLDLDAVDLDLDHDADADADADLDLVLGAGGGVDHTPGGGDAAAELVRLPRADGSPGAAPLPGGRDGTAGGGKYPPDGGDAAADLVRPRRADGSRYPSYSAAVARLAAPAVFANRPTYRLVDADLTGEPGRGRMVFGRGCYFDGLNVGEACAHEYAADAMGRGPGGSSTGSGAGGMPLRTAVGDPCDLGRRPTNVAISTLTVRFDRPAGAATFLLHWRDPAKVGHAGGLYQVVPVGVFQPSGDAAWNESNDFDLWRSIVREYAEELLGRSEDYDSERAPVDYGGWPFAARLGRARRDGRVRAFVLGMGTDPLTFATDILTAVVFDAPVFDDLFAGLVADNDEGRILAGLAPDAGDGIPFTAEAVDRFTRRAPMQAAGAALLALAWRHRAVLMGRIDA